MTNTTMTAREFFNAIAMGEMNETLMAFASEQISKLDAKNEARRSKPSKAQIANAPLKEAIVEFFKTHASEKFIASEVASQFEVDGAPMTTAKASGLLKGLVADGVLTCEEVKIPKVGKRQAYSLAE